MARSAHTQTAVTATRWRHLMPTLSSIKTMTNSGILSGSSHAGKLRGTVMAKTGLYMIMSVAPDMVPQPHTLSKTDKVPRQPTSLPMLMPDALTGEVPEIRPMTHLKDATPPTDHPHPWHPRMRKRDPHARLLTNAAFRWSLDPHPHQTKTFPVHPGAIYSHRPTWTFPLSVSYVSEKTTQQLHARVETVYAISVTRACVL